MAEERRAINLQLQVTLAKLDERTKYIKEKLDEHVDRDETAALSSDVSILQTNIMWIKRLSVGIPGLVLTCLGIWKGLK